MRYRSYYVVRFSMTLIRAGSSSLKNKLIFLILDLMVLTTYWFMRPKSILHFLIVIVVNVNC
ncbi:hypothetical protein HanRHA438_Chr08g0350321 [Helianthus annuus]|nr:hypothetical protein HanRHA438_Chr08g0350321 [Helianthus annuus]